MFLVFQPLTSWPNNSYANKKKTNAAKTSMRPALMLHTVTYKNFGNFIFLDFLKTRKNIMAKKIVLKKTHFGKINDNSLQNQNLQNLKKKGIGNQ
jgi:hypothetical protein